jgi:transposase InsO family protein
LPSKAVTDIVHCLKQHFAGYGLPDQVISDNSPFKLAEFSRFAAKHEFEHTTSSLNYAQSNGRVKNAIRSVKRLLTKAQEEHLNPYLALLDWRYTPAEQLGPISVSLF